MAKTQYIDIPDEFKNVYKNSVERRDRFILGVCQGRKRLLSRRARKLLSRASIVNSPQEGQGSLFRFLSPFWQALTPEQKALWTIASPNSSLTNWQLFISDCAVRIKNSLTFPISPSELWQVRTGYIKIEAPATQLVIKQEHPQNYWVAQKIVGQSWKKELVLIEELFTLPMVLAIRYKTNLTATGPTQKARYYAKVLSRYQGVDVLTEFSIDFIVNTDWLYASVLVSGLRGVIVGYTLFIEVIGYTGELFYDNIRATHSGQNWALDPRCDDISKVYTGAFAVVPPFWLPVELPDGATYSSQFPPAL